MICPFCRKSDLPDKSGFTICPACQTEMEIDERGECVFVNTDRPRMPFSGIVCTACGLIQQEDRESCVLCGNLFNIMVH